MYKKYKQLFFFGKIQAAYNLILFLDRDFGLTITVGFLLVYSIRRKCVTHTYIHIYIHYTYNIPTSTCHLALKNHHLLLFHISKSWPKQEHSILTCKYLFHFCVIRVFKSGFSVFLIESKEKNWIESNGERENTELQATSKEIFNNCISIINVVDVKCCSFNAFSSWHPLSSCYW